MEYLSYCTYILHRSEVSILSWIIAHVAICIMAYTRTQSWPMLQSLLVFIIFSSLFFVIHCDGKNLTRIPESLSNAPPCSTVCFRLGASLRFHKPRNSLHRRSDESKATLLMLVLLAGDVHVNPGPPENPCGVCARMLPTITELFVVIAVTNGFTPNAVTSVMQHTSDFRIHHAPGYAARVTCLTSVTHCFWTSALLKL